MGSKRKRLNFASGARAGTTLSGTDARGRTKKKKSKAPNEKKSIALTAQQKHDSGLKPILRKIGKDIGSSSAKSILDKARVNDVLNKFKGKSDFVKQSKKPIHPSKNASTIRPKKTKKKTAASRFKRG